MNHVYRLVWNSSLHAFVAVSECAKGMGKASRKKVGSLLPGVLLAATSVTALAQQAPTPSTLPTGGQVTAGAANISSVGNTLTVNQSSNRAAINWQSFSVGSNATVNFVQPSSSAITLNRVVGHERSVIEGSINANGQVWVLNANGVLFNRSAQVNTAGILASTLNISDADFMAGRSTFESNGGTGSVINLGTITTTNGGYVALLGQQVVNEGVITARLGSAVLASGDKVSLNFNGNSIVGVTIDRGTLNALVENKGAVLADGGLVVLTAKGLDQVMSTVVNNTGELRARTVEEKEGRIFLLGDMENDRINVGGRIDASAPGTGNGGFIETSAAKVNIESTLNVSTRSASGANGQWLIDPYDFVIAASGGDITGAALAAALANNNVVIETLSGSANCSGVSGCGTGNSAGNGDIFVNDSITKTSGGDTILTLKADHSIIFDSDVTISSTSNKLGVYLSANNDGNNNGVITMNSGSAIRSNGGNIIFGGALANGLPSDDRQVDVSIEDGATVNAGAGDITFLARDLEFREYVNVTGHNITSRTRNTSVNGADGVKVVASNNLDFSADDSIDLAGAYQAPAGFSYITLASQTMFSAGNSMSLSANSISLYGSVYHLTNSAGANILAITTQEDLSIDNSSFDFAGTPQLRLALMQGQGEAHVNSYNSAYTTLADYLAGESMTPISFATENGLINLYGVHFGLKGSSYSIKLFNDTTARIVSPKSIDNGLLAFGTGLEDSVNQLGNLLQPFYYDPNFNQWFKLTYSTYPLDIAIGLGGVSTTTWNGDGDIITSDGSGLDSAISNLTINTSQLSGGVGQVLVSYDVTAPTNSEVVHLSQLYSLGTGDRFIKTVTTMSNNGTAALENVRLWLGTRDDYIAITDSNYKTKGNLTANGFEPITDQDQQAKSILISQFDPINDGVTGSAILFHSTNTDADTVTDSCCSFSNVYGKNPRTSDIVTPGQDGSYALFMNYGTLAAGASRPVVWYYGVAPLSDINSLVTQINNAGGLEPDLFLTQNAPTVSPVLQNVVSDAVRSSIPTPTNTTALAMGPTQVQRQANVVNVPAGVDVQFGAGEPLLLVSSLDGDVPNSPVTLAQAQQMLGGGTASQGGGESSGNDADGGDRVVKVPASRNSLVQIVNGGVRLPSGVEQQLFVVKK